MATSSDRKIAEGLECLRQAEKCLKTSFFKWKPDIDGAVAEFNKAGIAFKNAKALEQARAAYIRCADVQKQAGTAFHSAKSLESAAMISRDMKELSTACDLVQKASLLYLEHGTPDTAAQALERAAKMIENEEPERAIMLYQKATDVAEGEDNTRKAAEMIGKAARLMLRYRKMDAAVVALKQEIDYYGQVDNCGMLNKLVMGLVMCHLYNGDYVAADQACQSCAKYAGFPESDEAQAILRLLQAYDEGDQEAADAELKSPLFRYMENDFTKLARDIRVPGGVKKSPSGSGGAEGGGDDEEEGYSDLL